MYRYIDPSDDSFLKDDEIYRRLKKQLNPFISNLKSEEDKQLILTMISNCYHTYYQSIKTKSESDGELLLSAIMALLIEQSNELERLSLLTKIRNIQCS
jgi:hypothetical protein